MTRLAKRCSILTLVVAVLCGAQAQAQTVDLKLRLTQGHTYRQAMETTTEVVQGPSGSAQAARMNIGMALAYQVTSVDPGTGDMGLRMTYEWATMRVKASDGSFDFDSRTSKGQVHPAAAAFAAVVGHSVGVILTSRGTVVALPGLEQFHKAIVDKIAPAPGPQRQAVEAAIAQQFGFNSVRAMVEGGFTVPERPIAVGQSWLKKMPAPLGTQAEVVNAYTLRELKTDRATINVAADLSVAGGALGATELKGTQTGELTIDPSTGWMTAAQFVQHLRGVAGGAPMSMRTTVTMTSR